MDSTDPPTDALADRLHSLAIHLLRRVRPADAEAGLSAARLSALSVLVFGGPAGVGELASAEQVTPATMSRLVTGLERQGLVRRASDPADARRVRVVATPAGEAALRSARVGRVARLATVVAALGPAERRAVESAVAALEGALERAPSPGGG